MLLVLERFELRHKLTVIVWAGRTEIVVAVGPATNKVVTEVLWAYVSIMNTLIWVVRFHARRVVEVTSWLNYEGATV